MESFEEYLVEKYKLTSRQLEVWKLISEGCLDKEIAANLFLAEGTIADHRKALYKNLRKVKGVVIRSKNDASILYLKELQEFKSTTKK